MEDYGRQTHESLDLSQSVFRGSGALYQSDRLTLGRTKSPLVIPGKQQVIEKVVYVQDDKSEQLAGLQGRLEDALMRLVLAAVERDKLARQLAAHSQQRANVFEHGERLEAQQLKVEVERLRQLLLDKEKEVLFVKEAEVRKSAIQSGDMALRLKLVTEENKRMQNANNDRITQINYLVAENCKVKDQVAVLTQRNYDPSENEETKKELNLKTSEIRSLRELVAALEKEKASNLGSQKQFMKDLAVIKVQLAEANSANEDLFRINSHLEKELEKALAGSANLIEIPRLLEENSSLTRNLDSLKTANLMVRDEMARQAVEFETKLKGLNHQIEAERRENFLKIDSRDKELTNLRTQISNLAAKLDAVSKVNSGRKKRCYRIIRVRTSSSSVSISRRRE
jgi:hypothetical protein